MLANVLKYFDQVSYYHLSVSAFLQHWDTFSYSFILMMCLLQNAPKINAVCACPEEQQDVHSRNRPPPPPPPPPTTTTATLTRTTMHDNTDAGLPACQSDGDSLPGGKKEETRLHIYSREEVSQHWHLDSCWVVLADQVYDITTFVNQVWIKL